MRKALRQGRTRTNAQAAEVRCRQALVTPLHRRPRRRPTTAAATAAAALTLAALTAAPLAPAAAAGTAANASTGTLAGTLVRAYVEAGPNTKGAPTAPGADQLTWVRTASGRTVRVPSTQVADVPAGAGVRLTVGGVRPGADDVPSAGRQVLGAAVITAPPSAGSTTSRTAGAARTTAPATGVQQITLVQAVPGRASATSSSFKAGSTTISALTEEIRKASSFWSVQTGGRVQLKVVKSVPWTRLSTSCNDPDRLWAEAARKAGWTEAVGRHLVVQLPEPADLGGCGAGLGTVGRYLGDGGTTWTSYADWAVIAHELGHNFGLGHANALACGSSADKLSGCTEQAYQDGYDVMGVSWWNTGSLSTAHLDQLGLMTSATQRDVTRSVSAAADLRPVGGHRGLQSLTFVDRGVRYWVEYRGAVGYDRWTSTSAYRAAHYNDGYTPGILVRRVGPTSNPQSEYYDSRVLLRPRGVLAARSTKPQWTLRSGQSMQVATHRTIYVTRVSSGSAHVIVETSAPLTAVRSTARTSGQTVNGVAYHRSSSLTVTFSPTPRMPRNGFRVLVDGVVRATAKPTSRSATLTGLRPGRHTVAVRAVDGSRTLTSPVRRVLIDRTAPTFSTAPALQLRKGARISDLVPLRLQFAAADSVRLSRLSWSPGTTLPMGSRSVSLTQRPGTTVARTLAATDAAGNTAQVTLRTQARLGSEVWGTRYSRGWSTVSDRAALGGTVRRSGSRGAAAVLTTTGTDVGLVATTGPALGRVLVSVDGRPATTVDLRSATTATRRVVWTRHLTSGGPHTVRVVVEGTSGRPAVSLDGWAVLG
jgi:hypothetical protein